MEGGRGRIVDERISRVGPTEQTLEGWIGLGRTEVNSSRLKGV